MDEQKVTLHENEREQILTAAIEVAKAVSIRHNGNSDFSEHPGHAAAALVAACLGAADVLNRHCHDF